MEAILVIAALSIPIALNLWATRRVVADDFASKTQQRGQLAFVWLLPVLGAIIVLGVHRKFEPPSKQYRSGSDPGDDYTYSAKNVRATKEALDGD